MTQELIELRLSILKGRYADALSIVDELEGMSKKAILRQIKSFVIRMLIHLIKNQIEQRLTNPWAASIRDSILEIQDLNLRENQTFHYIKLDEWSVFLEDCLDSAIFAASVEIVNGAYSPFQLAELLDKTQILTTANDFLRLTYSHPPKVLASLLNEKLNQLPGGEDWKLGRQR